MDLAGAGGKWKTIDERIDSTVVKQMSDISCGAACGEMLLLDRGVKISQIFIASLTGVPSDAASLARSLNKLDTEKSRLWGGGELVIPGATPLQLLKALNTTGSWAAVLWEIRAKIGHFVIVDGLETKNNVMIRDPQGEGTKYLMELKEFFKYWNQQGVYLRKL
jgi:filamentous hemagglutinin